MWQKAVQLVVEIYRFTKTFPRAEQFGLTNQMRRAAVSIPSNIAEGRGRGSARDYQRFAYIARGSAHEVQTHAILAKELEFTTDSDPIIAKTEEVIRLLNGLIRYLEKRP